jgi:hypothetical protein
VEVTDAALAVARDAPRVAHVDLYWLPLGAGGHFVRLNGRAYEALKARRGGRERQALYHAALAVQLIGRSYVIEMTPVRRGDPVARGVVAEGAVGSTVLGHLRLFRYEVRRWRDGEIPDVEEAVHGPQRLATDPRVVRHLLELVPSVPIHVWGRDVLGVGDMWNSNSLVAWLLTLSGIDAVGTEPPRHGRAPGWLAGLAAAGQSSTRAFAAEICIAS